MDFKVDDAKILFYFRKYRTKELVEKIINRYHDNTLDDDMKKRKIARYSAAIAMRNFKNTRPKSLPIAKSKHTFEIVDEIEKIYHDSSLSDDDMKKQISRYCLALALRQGFIRLKE